MANPHPYAMLATMETQVKVKLLTTITIDGSHDQQIVRIQLNPRSGSILGRTYANLFQNLLTQTINLSIPVPRVHLTKRLTSRRTEKMLWASTLLQDPDTRHSDMRRIRQRVRV